MQRREPAPKSKTVVGLKQVDAQLLSWRREEHSPRGKKVIRVFHISGSQAFRIQSLIHLLKIIEGLRYFYVSIAINSHHSENFKKLIY